jgi:hypothetical protein
LRLHLANIHKDEWISELKKRNITVTAKAGLKALAHHEGKTLETPSRPSYSPELFVDTLVDFIVATDQVFLYFNFFSYTKYFSLAYQHCGLQGVPLSLSFTQGKS